MPNPSPKPRIALGADHAGFPMKETIRQFLENAGYPLEDVGTWSQESVDYPDYGKAVGDRVATHRLRDCGVRDGYGHFHLRQQGTQNPGGPGARRARHGWRASTMMPTS